MESRTKKRLFNAVMLILIGIIILSGVMTVGNIKGWFGKKDSTGLTSGKITGVVNIQRSGIGYSLDKNVALMEGDLIETKKGAQAEIAKDEDSTLVLNENTQVSISGCRKESLSLETSQGEFFADLPDLAEGVGTTFGDNVLLAEDAVFALNVQTGSSTVYVFAGEAEITAEDGTRERVESGECAQLVSQSDDTFSVNVTEMQAASLNEFLIRQALRCGSSKDLCFTEEELQAVLDDREAQKQAALEESLNSGSRIPKQTGGTGQGSAEAPEAAEGYYDAGEGYQEYAGTQDGAGEADPAPAQEDNSNTDGGGAGGEPFQKIQAPQEESVKTCTITIVCDTILNNMENLSAGKEAYVPANGCILAASTVEFTEGETVFDVLTRVCSYAGIQIEYSWTPLYNSYYIEGINNLYEFDCGNESGWMYKVNGWFPNYGCSSYTLADGDVIVWCYTCNGLGVDVGAPAF